MNAFTVVSAASLNLTDPRGGMALRKLASDAKPPISRLSSRLSSISS